MRGCAGRVLLQNMTDSVPGVIYPLIGLTGFVELSALASWGIELWRTIDIVKKNPASDLVMPLPLTVRLKLHTVHNATSKWLSLDSEDYNQLMAVERTN
jgi:hypothetical protein